MTSSNQSKIVLTTRRWWQRGSANHGWLKTFHTFSFASYYDPLWENFGCLRVVNEDRVAPKTGFPTHPHKNAEIFSYIVNGKLTHKDSMGNIETLQRGEVQFTSAGKGISHSEYNDNQKEECHFLQIWYIPRKQNLPPKYYTLPQIQDEEKTNKLFTLIRDIDTFSPEEQQQTGLLPLGRAIPAHCSLTTRTSILTPGHAVKHSLGNESKQTHGERWSFIHLAMNSGWKDPEEMERIVRKDIVGYTQHQDRLKHASRYCQAVYGIEPTMNASSTQVKRIKSNSKFNRARVTLTYAQSKDGKIAGENKKMLALSNAESMIMTHTLRIIHDGILIGVNTLINDNPQLNARLLNPLLDESSVPLNNLPRPIVVDSKLRIPHDCKLLNNARQGVGKKPLIFTSNDVDEKKLNSVREAGAEVEKVTVDKQGYLSWSEILTKLKQDHQIESVMVEGGATIIESLYVAHSKEALIDEVIITVSPMIVGEKGLSYKAPKWITEKISKDQMKTSNSISNENPLLQPLSEPQIFQSDVILTWSNCQNDMTDKHEEAKIRVGNTVLSEGDGVFLRGGEVGETIEIVNVGNKNAEFLLFDLEPEHSY